MFFSIQPQSNPVLSIQNVNQLTQILGRTLQPGQTLQAVVQSFDPVQQQAVIRTSNQSLTAQTQLPFIEGQNLTLLIESVEPQVVLRLLNSNRHFNQSQIRVEPNLSQQQIQNLLQNLTQESLVFQNSNGSSYSAPKVPLPDLLQYFLPLIKDGESSQTIKQLIRVFNQPVEATLAKLLKGQPIAPKEVFQDPVSQIRQILNQQSAETVKPAVKNLLSSLISPLPTAQENSKPRTVVNAQQPVATRAAQNLNPSENINSKSAQTPLEPFIRQFTQLVKTNAQPQLIQTEIENLLNQFNKQKPDAKIIRQVTDHINQLKTEISANPKILAEPHIKAILEHAIYQTIA